jgi:hypothetical protein
LSDLTDKTHGVFPLRIKELLVERTEVDVEVFKHGDNFVQQFHCRIPLCDSLFM